MSTAYDLYLYPTKAQPQLWIGNLHTVAFLKGFQPRPLGRARVLEVGCGTGMNLLPMAASLPEAEFVGVDLAAQPILLAKQLAARFGVSNVRFHQADIQEMADDFGQFDYILAHGFYSWVPPSARESLWRVARGSLSAQGLLQVSYNALPGALQMKYLREFCQLHMRRFADRETQLREAWNLVTTLASMKDADNPLAMAAAQTVAKGFATAIHDEFASINDPFYLEQVVEAAAAWQLRYVADAVQKFMLGLQRLPEGQALLESLPPGDELLHEQYRDFLSYRGFRQSIFTPMACEPEPVRYGERLRQCYLASPLRAGSPDEAGNRVYDAPNAQMGFHSSNPLLAELFEAFAMEDPIPVSLDDFCKEALPAHHTSRPEIVDEFWELLEDLAGNGIIQAYAERPPIPTGVPERPKMAGIGRWEALLGVPLTNVFHRGQNVDDPLLRALAGLTDGTRTVAEISAALADLVVSFRQGRAPHAVMEGFPIPLGESVAYHRTPEFKLPRLEVEQFLLKTIPAELERFRQLGLLVAG